MSTGPLLGHLAPPIEPGELWTAWSTDPLVWLVLIGALIVHERGWRGGGSSPSRRRRWRRRAFLAAIGAAAVALVSPLDALSASLASAHMTQHLLLTVVVAPLLVLSAPTGVLLRGIPRAVALDRHHLRRLHRVHVSRLLGAHPILLGAIHAATLWAWHASGPYELALRNDLVHRVEHAMFLATAVASWAAILFSWRRRRRATIGIGVLVLFALSVQGSLLGTLLAFAREPWYPSYGTRATPWGLTAIEDQQLAGVIMWVPGGVSYLLAALAATTLWIAGDTITPLSSRGPSAPHCATHDGGHPLGSSTSRAAD